VGTYRKLLLETPRFDVYVDHVRQRDGLRRDYYYVSKPSAVAIVLHTSSEVLFLRTRRHRCPGVALELPGGRIESGESELQAAQRELREELRLTNVPLHRIGVVYALASITDERVFMFSGALSDRARQRISLANDEGFVSTRWVRLADVAQAIQKNVRSAIDGYAALLFLSRFSDGG